MPPEAHLCGGVPHASRGGCHAVCHVHTTQYPLYSGWPKETYMVAYTTVVQQTLPVCNSSLDAMLGIATQQHAHPWDAIKRH